MLRNKHKSLGSGLILRYNLINGKGMWGFAALVNTVMNFRALQNAGNFLCSWGPVTCSGRPLPWGSRSSSSSSSSSLDHYLFEAGGSAVSWGSALQAGRPLRPVQVCTEISLPLPYSYVLLFLYTTSQSIFQRKSTWTNNRKENILGLLPAHIFRPFGHSAESNKPKLQFISDIGTWNLADLVKFTRMGVEWNKLETGYK